MLVYVDEKQHGKFLNLSDSMEQISNAYAWLGPVDCSITYGLDSIEADISIDVHFFYRVAKLIF
jgi:hypothetical protein